MINSFTLKAEHDRLIETDDWLKMRVQSRRVSIFDFAYHIAQR